MHDLVLLLFAYAEQEALPPTSGEIEPTIEVEDSNAALADSQESFWSDKEFCEIRVTEGEPETKPIEEHARICQYSVNRQRTINATTGPRRNRRYLHAEASGATTETRSSYHIPWLAHRAGLDSISDSPEKSKEVPCFEGYALGPSTNTGVVYPLGNYISVACPTSWDTARHMVGKRCRRQTRR